MKHSSRKKRGNKRFHRKPNKKEMKSAFTITAVVLVLFVVLIVFSIFSGPVEKKEAPDKNLGEESTQDIIQEIKNKQSENIGENPSINANNAIASGDISICKGDEYCENSFIYDKALKSGNPDDCNEINKLEVRENCKDNVYFSKTIETGDKSFCAQINDLEFKSICEGI
jgi:competence protein ComGC